jgi:alkanesulfonate monooxygenase SsuD/methylene tetrahydromethanopterin reductase-like flavin-dependent oxidoreductase (luciferase family)
MSGGVPHARPVSFGAMYMGGEITVKQFAVAAEQAGFDSVWVGDHLVHYVDGISSLGIMAGCTERVALGTNVIVAPFRSPSVIAKAALTVAASAQRPLILGLGPGGDVPVEFSLVNADLTRRGRYTDEAIEVIRGHWSGSPFGFDGAFSRFEPVVMEPRTSTLPSVWIGGRSTAALMRAVRLGDGINPYLVSPRQVGDRFDTLRSYARDEARDLDGFTFAATTFHVSGRTIDEAFEAGYPRCGFRGVSEQQYRDFYLLGNEGEVIAGVQRYLAAGVEHLVIGCAPGHPRQLESFTATFMTLLPELRGGMAARIREDR